MADENKFNMYTGIGVMAALIGWGGFNYLTQANDSSKVKAEVQKTYIQLQTEMVKQGVITNVSQIKLSELEKL